jgi:uncharacterized protein (DUF849 family)
MVAPNGARRGPSDHPALPVTPGQIAACARDCAAAGADALHLHVRDREGRHSLDPGLYREALDEIARAAPGLRIQVTTEAAGRFDVAAQLDCLARLRPAWASVSIREVARAPDLAPRLYALCADQGTEVQHILYDAADADRLRDWRARGMVGPGAPSVLHVLGRDGAAGPGDVAARRDAVPYASGWMACAFGPAEHDVLIEAARLGGALRVGFENALTDRHGRPHADNAASVAALRAALERTFG